MGVASAGQGFGVVVAAGGSAPTALQRAEGVRTKGQLLVDGTPCLARVCATVQQVQIPAVVVGGPEARDLTCGLPFVPERDGAVANFRAGVESLPACTRFVFLPSDAPFLSSSSLAAFAEACSHFEGAWLAVGLCSAKEYKVAFPECPKRSVRTREGRFHTGALYGGERRAFLHALDQLDGLFRDRRSQVAMARRIGLVRAAKFALGSLSLAEAEAAFERVLGVPGKAVTGCGPETVVDVDDEVELAQVRDAARRLARQEPTGSPA